MTSTRRDWFLFTALTFCFSFGFAVYTGIFQNFLRDALHAGPAELGTLESLREVPGLLTAFLAGTLVALAESRLAAVALAVCAGGIAATGNATGFWPLVAITVAWSVGAHLWLAVSPAITLSLAGGREGGRHLGRMTGVGAVAVLSALALTRVAKEYLAYDALFRVAGVVIFIAAILAAMIRHRAPGGRRLRLVYRPEYRLYYLLTFLEGCRRQIFATFATFVLIVVYNQDVKTMLTLAFVNASLTAVAGPCAGRLIDRFGERPTLLVYYALLIFVFAGYALVSSVPVLYALYLIDNVLFTCGAALTVYLHRLARPGDMTPSLAMGTTMNHIAAVTVPVTGGLLWTQYGNYQIPFWIGVGVLLISIAAARRLPAGSPGRPAEPAAV